MNQENAGVRWRCLPRLLRFLWELGSRELLLIGAFSVLGGLLPALAVFCLRGLVDSAAAAAAGMLPIGAALGWLGALVAANALDALIGSGSSGWFGLAEEVQERLRARAQERLIEKAGRLPLATFERPDFHDQLRRAQAGLETRFLRILDSLLPIPSILVTGVALLLYLAASHPLLPLVLLLGLIPPSVATARDYLRAFYTERRHTAPERLLRYLGDLMVERKAAAEIRLFGLQEYLLRRRQDVFVRLRDDRLRRAREKQRALVLPGLMEQAPFALVVAGLVALIARGTLSLGQFAAALGAAERFRDSFGRIFMNVALIDSDLRSLQDLFGYLDLPEEVAGSRVLAAAPGEERPPVICFESVTFAYPGSERTVLENLHLTIRPGERLALVGENGAGKSTLTRLLLGLYRPTSGRVTIDGIDLAEIDPLSWRSRAAAVFQDYMRYELTARENIGFGDLSRLGDRDAIHAAAVRSGADAVVASLPAAYETTLGRVFDEAGQDLSVGQWQKLAIARACLREEAVVLVLDEPAAALDARSEVEVYRRFRDVAGGRTVLFISHRLGSARLADRILVLEGGRIVEEGTHVELVRRNGRYARMYAVQAAWYV